VVSACIALLADAPLLEQANPAYPENPAKSPWYFLGIQELVSYSAFAGGLLVPLLYLIFLFSIPYVDRENPFVGAMVFRVSAGSNVWCGVSALFALVLFVVIQVALEDAGSDGLRDWVPGS
jgi:quinol-cytochrome oxidoreductase complex cytochrome b subunit